MASRMLFLRSLLRLMKKLTVIGIIGQTQGVTSASKPPKKPKPKMTRKPLLVVPCSSPPKACKRSMTGVQSCCAERLSIGATAICVLSGAALFGVAAESEFSNTAASIGFAPDFSAAAASAAVLLGPSLPETLQSTLVGGRQFWSLHAP